MLDLSEKMKKNLYILFFASEVVCSFPPLIRVNLMTDDLINSSQTTSNNSFAAENFSVETIVGIGKLMK